MAWPNKSTVYLFVILLVAIFRYNWGLSRSCHIHSSCPPNKKYCCNGECSKNCSFVCSSHDNCTIREYCCGFNENLTGKCAKSCISKTCESNRDCTFREYCCNKKCARSCFGQSCSKNSDCGFGKSCCGRNATANATCASSCLGNMCTDSSHCGSGEVCCGNDVGITGVCSSTCDGNSCKEDEQCGPNGRCCNEICSKNCSYCRFDGDCRPGLYCCGRSGRKQCMRSCIGRRCSNKSGCAFHQLCCGPFGALENRCAWSCIGKSCVNNRNCGSGEKCCSPNSGIRQCAKSCTIGKWCLSHFSCEPGQFCCLINKTGEDKKCARSCPIEKFCVTKQDCAPDEQCCGSRFMKCSRNCFKGQGRCLKDEDCFNGECCKFRRCLSSCSTHKARSQNTGWHIAVGLLIGIPFIIIVSCIGCRIHRKAREAEASRRTIDRRVTRGVTRRNINPENQRRHQYDTEQEPSDGQNTNSNHPPPSYPTHAPPPYTGQPLTSDQSTTPTHNQPPPPYLKLS